MNRKEWEFEYTGKQLSDAAYAKCEHHKCRLAWWEGQKEGVMLEIRESGLEVNDTLAASFSTGVAIPQIMVRNDLQTKLNECHQKIKEHTAKVQEYDGWHQALLSNLETKYKLHQDDWLFFFGK